MEQWIEHDHDHEDEETTNSKAPLQSAHSCRYHDHAHANAAGGKSERISKKDYRRSYTVPSKARSVPEGETVSFNDSDDDSDAWTDISEDDAGAREMEQEPPVDPRAPSETSLHFETEEIRVGEAADQHLRKYFPKLVPNDDILVVVGSIELKIKP